MVRLVSLVPSLSRTVCDLGLKDRIVGCTSYCISPSDLYKSATVVGGTKDPNFNLIEELKPTYILVNEEENTPEIIERCTAIANTIRTAPILPEDSVQLIKTLGEQLECSVIAVEIAARIENLLDQIRQRNEHHIPNNTFLYLIWRNPYMAAGKHTYLSNLVSLLGWRNILSEEPARYPALAVEQLCELHPSHILFTSEPYPFRKRHIREYSQIVGTRGQFFQADGQLFTWWGTLAEEAFSEILNYWDRKHCRLIRQVHV